MCGEHFRGRSWALEVLGFYISRYHEQLSLLTLLEHVRNSTGASLSVFLSEVLRLDVTRRRGGGAVRSTSNIRRRRSITTGVMEEVHDRNDSRTGIRLGVIQKANDGDTTGTGRNCELVAFWKGKKGNGGQRDTASFI